MRRRASLAAAAFVVILAQAPAAGAADSSSIQSQLAAAQRQANQAAARLAAAQTALARLGDDVAGLRARQAATKARLGELEGAVRNAAVSQYMEGRAPSAVGIADIGEVARGQAMLQLVTLGSIDAIDAYRSLRQDLDASTAALNKRLSQQKGAYAALQREQSAAVAELDKLAAREQALAAKAAADKKAAAARTAAASTSRARGIIATGSWICPVQGPHSFSNDWGQPRPGGRTHQGNDILAPRGTPVVASVSGVATANSNSLGGIAYFLHGVDGNTYYGAHLQGYGQLGNVQAGTVIGYVGNTGDAAGGPTHLHFEIHPGGGPAVNPYPTLVKYC
jgi:murein DD-endopeptidase MepM/ murein hydrolase activator NlpD